MTNSKGSAESVGADKLDAAIARLHLYGPHGSGLIARLGGAQKMHDAGVAISSDVARHIDNEAAETIETLVAMLLRARPSAAGRAPPTWPHTVGVDNCARVVQESAGRAEQRAWPFQRSPGAVANSLNEALAEFGDMLPAVRNVFIENAEPLYAPEVARAEPAMEPVAWQPVMKALIRAYLLALENGRDRILLLGGECDTVEFMEREDPYIRAARELLAAPVLAAPPTERADSVSQQGLEAGISSERSEPVVCSGNPDDFKHDWPQADKDNFTVALGKAFNWPAPSPAPAADNLVAGLRAQFAAGDTLAGEAAEAIEARDRTIAECHKVIDGDIEAMVQAEADAERKGKALAELVACKDLHKARHAAVNREEWLAIDEEYERRMPLAWAAARAALGTP